MVSLIRNNSTTLSAMVGSLLGYIYYLQLEQISVTEFAVDNVFVCAIWGAIIGATLGAILLRKDDGL